MSAYSLSKQPLPFYFQLLCETFVEKLFVSLTTLFKSFLVIVVMNYNDGSPTRVNFRLGVWLSFVYVYSGVFVKYISISLIIFYLS